MGTGHHSLAAGEPFGWARLIEGGRLGVQLHVPGIYPRPVHPWVVEIALPCLDEEHLQIMVQVCQAAVLSAVCIDMSVEGDKSSPTSHHTSATPPTADNDIKLLRERAQRRVRDVLSHVC